MKSTKWNAGWKYWKEKDAFSLIWDEPTHAVEVELPHDAMLDTPAVPDSRNAKNTGYRDGDCYVYNKQFFVGEECKEETIVLKVEGTYMNTFLYVNGQLASHKPYGYSVYYVDIHPFIKFGQKNEVRFIIKNGGMSNSRWYSGGGIYRDVYLFHAGLVFIKPNKIRIECRDVSGDASIVKITTDICNRNYLPNEVKIRLDISFKHQICSSDELIVILEANSTKTFSKEMLIRDSKLWSAENPSLYSCKFSVIDQKGEVLDEADETFGIRKISVNPKDGFQINGKTVKLRGACIHHDNGLVGAETYDFMERRRIRKLKEAGFNAIRMAHNPISPVLLRVCDELGMYVMDETFDMWTRCKTDFDYANYFMDEWEKDVTCMVENDFNHPCVVMYSLGNEIPEIGLDHGLKVLYELTSKVKELDFTRFTLCSVNGAFIAGDCIQQIMADVAKYEKIENFESGNVNQFMGLMSSSLGTIVQHDIITHRLDKIFSLSDIAGYNYMETRYDKDLELHPNRIIVGSETNPPYIARLWESVLKHPQIIGDFTWAGWDYIGESGMGVAGYPSRSGGFSSQFPIQLSYLGDIDIIGERKPVSFYREIVFGIRKEPYIAVCDPAHYGEEAMLTPWILSDTLSSWTFPDRIGKPVIVEVYAPGEEVELLLNGKSFGKKGSGKNADFRSLFEIVYEPGVLEAICYENGDIISKSRLLSADKETILTVSDESEYSTDDVKFISIAVADKNGTIDMSKELDLEAFVEGGSILGFGSGTHSPVYNYRGNKTRTFQGKALMIVRRKEKKKLFTVKVKACNGMEAVTAL